MEKKDILNAYIKIRQIDNTIPDDVLDFMKNAAIEKIEMSEFCKCTNTRTRTSYILNNTTWCSQCYQEIKVIT